MILDEDVLSVWSINSVVLQTIGNSFAKQT